MKSIIESLLDDEDVILSRTDKTADLAAAAAWLEAHGMKGAEEIIKRYNRKDEWEDWVKKWINPETGEWTMQEDMTITITDKDKTIPDYVKISSVSDMNIQGWKGTELPFKDVKVSNSFSIRNCPNLKTLNGCPEEVERFSVSGCPKITSLDGAPKKVTKMFKAVNNGKVFSDKDIKRVCKVDKKNMIYG